MKSIYLLAALLTAALPAAAQISIGSTDGPRAGDSLSLYFVSDSLFAGVDITSAAPGQTWNFSLPGWASGFGGREMVTVGRQGIPDDPVFAGATLALVERRRMPEFGTSDETYTFLGIDQDRLVELGTSISLSTGSGPRTEYRVVEKNEGYRLPLPISYGDRWSNRYRTLLYRTPVDTSLDPAPRLASTSQVTTTSEVDGWGTVATPHGAFRALRVHSIEISTDSLFTELGAYDGTIADTLETYDWYTQTTGAYLPVVSLEVVDGKIASAQMLRFTSNTSLVAELGDEEATEIFLGEGAPNPAATTITIPYAARGGGGVSMAIYDMLGNVVRTPVALQLMEEEGSVEVDLSDLPQGSYICRLESEGRSVARPIVVRR